MIHFDRQTLSILRYIQRSGKQGVTWETIWKKFGEEDANSLLLEVFSEELYTITKGHDEEWLAFDDRWDRHVYGDFRSFCTAKGNELLEKRSFDFWKWVIPTIISVIALVVSFISVLK